MTEVQVGSYLFMDREYRDALAEDPEGAFATSLFVQAQVISANHPNWVTIDAGLKSMATDGPLPRPVGARFSASRYHWFGDEHGMLTRPPGEVVQHGERVELESPHCDPTVDRYDVMYFVRCDNLEHIHAVDGRGRSQ
jgi:D-serine deaminase-like pyridoxal phosphate-dependent protein